MRREKKPENRFIMNLQTIKKKKELYIQVRKEVIKRS